MSQTVRISDLPQAGALTGSEIIPGVQGGQTVGLLAAQLAALAGSGGGASGWSPLYRSLEDGDRTLLEIYDWTGGIGEKPATGFLSASGLVQDIAQATDLRGVAGKDGEDGQDGALGLSAYQIAVLNGFVGSELQWLASLKGDKGDKGDPGDGGTGGDFVTKTDLAVFAKKTAPRRFYVSDYGAKQDRRYSRGTVTNRNVTTATPQFSSADVGKLIKFPKGKVTGLPFIDQIIAYISPNEVLLANNLPRGTMDTEIIWGTNDREAYQAAINAVCSFGEGDYQRGGELVMGNSIIAGELDPQSKGLLYIPANDFTDNPVPEVPTFPPIRFLGGREQPRQGDYGYFQEAEMQQTGAIVESFQDIGTGWMLGFRTKPTPFSAAGNYTHIDIDGLIFRNVYGSAIGGIEGVKLIGGLKPTNFSIDVDRSTFIGITPTATGISFPQYYNNTDARTDNLMVYGYGNGVITNEHFTAGYISIFACQNALLIDGSGHGQRIERVLIQGYKSGISSVDGASATIKISQADFERTGAAVPAWYQSEYEIDLRPGGSLLGRICMLIVGDGNPTPLCSGYNPGLHISTLRDGQLNVERFYQGGGPGCLNYTVRSTNRHLTDDGAGLEGGSDDATTEMDIQMSAYAGCRSYVESGTFLYKNGYGVVRNRPTGNFTRSWSPTGNAVNWAVNRLPSTTAESDFALGSTLTLWNLTKAQRDALVGKVPGMAIYQTDNSPGLRVWNGTNWMKYTETAD